ncbi:unnamed protein product, partial [Rotaria magnacalcarata]
MQSASSTNSETVISQPLTQASTSLSSIDTTMSMVIADTTSNSITSDFETFPSTIVEETKQSSTDTTEQ